MGCGISTEVQVVGGTRREMAPKALLDALYFRDFENARQLLRTPDAVLLVEFHDSILCEACQGNAPIDIIRSIYYLSSRQALHKNRHGLTPLHYSCFAESTDEVRHFLLNIAPEATYMADNNGHLPIHAAIRTRKTCEFLKQLLLAYPESVNACAKDGSTPLTLFISKWKLRLENIWIRHGGFINITRDHQDYVKVQMAKEVLLLLVKVLSCNGVIENDYFEKKWLPLHTILKLENAPYIFMQLITELMPEEWNIKDEQGNLPLHLALTMSHQKHLSDELIKFLCHHNETNAKEPNAHGDYPLALAIENGCGLEILECLHMAAPDIVSTPSKVEGAYPVMLSFSSPKSSIDVAYELLRLDPSVIQTAILCSEETHFSLGGKHL